MGDLSDLQTKPLLSASILITELWGYLMNRHEISLLFLLLLFASGACGQAISSFELDGFVYSANGSRLPPIVNVDLCDVSGTVIQLNSATSAGRFHFEGVRAADYILKISADSFEPQEIHINLEFGNLHGVIVYLKPISSNPASPSSVADISLHELSMPVPAHELLLAGRTKLYRENKPQQALDDFLQAQRKAPGYYELNYEIGMAYLNLGQKEKARNNFLKAIDLSKDTYGDPQIALGTLLVDQGNLDEGEKKIQHGLLLTPHSWMGYYQLARVKLLQGLLPEAETAAEQARSLAPKAALNYQLLSIIHLRQKKYAQLLEDIDRYLELDPNSPAGQRARAVRDQVIQEIKKEQISESRHANDAAVNTGTGHSESTVLDPTTQKELNEALEALRADRPANAKKHLQWASQVAPADPEVTYAWGMYYAETKDWTNAETYWQKTLLLDPHYPFARAGLAQLALRNGDLPEAIDNLERAVQASPSSWHLEERLAQAYFLHQEYDQAEKHAEHAIEMSKDRASLAQLILAKVYLKRNDSQLARGVLDRLLAHQPSGPRAEEAQHLVTSLRQSPGATLQSVGDGFQNTKSAAFELPGELVPPTRWMPPDVDERIPPVELGVACPLQKIQEETGKRVSEFVRAVNSITATETLEHEVIDVHGVPTKRESRSYTYVASLQEDQAGHYKVEEYRNGKTGLDIFPDHLATFGLTSLVMIFHPAYRDEYEFSCEGLSRWYGGKAWQVHFRQRPDKPVRVRGYHMGEQVYLLSLRGRAWIAVDSFQIVNIETDLVAPLPQIPLNAEHISIEYAPVQFLTSKQELWLPQSAELYTDFNIRRIHRSHHFSNYMVFSVDETQRISPPSPKSNSDSAPPEQKQNF